MTGIRADGDNESYKSEEFLRVVFERGFAMTGRGNFIDPQRKYAMRIRR